MNFSKQSLRNPVPWTDEKFYLVTISTLAAMVTLLVMNLDLQLNRNFISIACDTAGAQNTIVNLLHGNWFRNTAYGGPSSLGQHTMFLPLLVAPVYALLPSVETLLTLQVFGVYSALIPLYLVALEILRRPLPAFLLAATALPCPLLLDMALAPYNSETWFLTIILWSYFFYRRNNLPGFCLSFALAVCCGEQAALIYVALGVTWLLVDDGIAWRRRYGLIALAGGMGWVVLAVGVLVPLMRSPDQVNLFSYNYPDWQVTSATSLPWAVAHNPNKALLMLFNPIRWLRLATIVGLPLLLAFTSLRSVLLLAPLPLYFLMSNQEFFLYFHAYYFQFAILSGYLGLLFFLVRWDATSRVGVVVLVATAAIYTVSLCPGTALYFGSFGNTDEAFSATLRDTFAKIPTEAGVYGPHRYSAYLSNRVNMVMGDIRDENLDFDAMIEHRYPETTVHANQIDFIVSDLQNDQCGWRQSGYIPEASQMRITNFNRLMQTGQWRVFWNQNDVVILQRVGK